MLSPDRVPRPSVGTDPSGVDGPAKKERAIILGRKFPSTRPTRLTFAFLLALGAPLGLAPQAGADASPECRADIATPLVLVGDGAGAGDASATAPRTTGPGCWSGQLADEADVDTFRLDPWRRMLESDTTINRYRLTVWAPDEGCFRAELFIDGKLAGSPTLCAGDGRALGLWIRTRDVVLRISEGPATYHFEYV